MNQLMFNAEAVPALASAQITATTNGIVVDTLGYNNVLFAILSAAFATGDDDNYFTASIQEGDETDLSDAAAVPAARVLGTAPVFNDTTLDASSVFQLGAKCGTKRYMRLVLTETGTADLTVGAVALLGGPRTAPVVPSES